MQSSPEFRQTMILDATASVEKDSENTEKIFQKLTENYTATRVDPDPSDNEDVEYCLISIPADLPLSSLNKLSVKNGSRKKELDCEGRKATYWVTCTAVDQLNHQVLHVSKDISSNMIVQQACHRLDIRAVVESTAPNLNNCLPRALPPPVPGSVQVRFKPFGWQEPPEIKHKLVHSPKKSPKKKHKRTLGNAFEVDSPDIIPASDDDVPPKKQKKKLKKIKKEMDTNAVEFDSNTIQNHNPVVDNENESGTTVSDINKQQKTKVKKHKHTKTEKFGKINVRNAQFKVEVKEVDEKTNKKRKKDKKVKKEKNKEVKKEKESLSDTNTKSSTKKKKKQKAAKV